MQLIDFPINQAECPIVHLLLFAERRRDQPHVGVR
jgi:hypothetical protein